MGLAQRGWVARTIKQIPIYPNVEALRDEYVHQFQLEWNVRTIGAHHRTIGAHHRFMPPADYPLVTVDFRDGADCDVDLQLEQALTALGLVGQVRTLGEQNEQCRRLVNQRNEQRSFTDNQAMQKARKVTDAAYADFVMMLNAYNVVSLGTSQGQYEQAIQIINADIDYYKQWVLRKGGSSDEGGEDDPDEGGDTPAPEDGGSGEVTPVTPVTPE